MCIDSHFVSVASHAHVDVQLPLQHPECLLIPPWHDLVPVANANFPIVHGDHLSFRVVSVIEITLDDLPVVPKQSEGGLVTHKHWGCNQEGRRGEQAFVCI